MEMGKLRYNESNFRDMLFKVKGSEVIKSIEKLIRQGNVSKITVKRNDRKIITIPVNGGIFLAVFFPYLIVLSSIIILMADYELFVEKHRGDIL